MNYAHNVGHGAKGVAFLHKLLHKSNRPSEYTVQPHPVSNLREKPIHSVKYLLMF